LLHEFTAVNEDQNFLAFAISKPADLTKNDCFTRARGHNQQSPIGLHDSDPNAGDGLLLIGT
jgi:hypothetical protein